MFFSCDLFFSELRTSLENLYIWQTCVLLLWTLRLLDHKENCPKHLEVSTGDFSEISVSHWEGTGSICSEWMHQLQKQKQEACNSNEQAPGVMSDKS